MKTEVRIAELKANLSKYLRAAQRGEEIVVKDRDTPIARLAPIQKVSDALIVRKATKSIADVNKIGGIKVKGLKPGVVDEALRLTKQDYYDKWLESQSTSTRRS